MCVRPYDLMISKLETIKIGFAVDNFGASSGPSFLAFSDEVGGCAQHWYASFHTRGLRRVKCARTLPRYISLDCDPSCRFYPLSNSGFS